jgi:hypothetical protein
MRYFNTSGPNNPHEHYTLMRPKLMAEGLEKVRRNRYFTIWAPRQTGKSTFFQLLTTELIANGYKVAHCNFENYKDAVLSSFLEALQGRLESGWGTDFSGNDLHQTFDAIAKIKDQRFVLIIDEVEGINPAFFGQFLHSIRNAYHSRAEHSLKSVILVGVSNIIGVVQDNASPFNIADNLLVPYFTDEETRELLGQHEAETGQIFDPSVIAKISEITANQPGLVNGFALKLTEDYPTKPVLTYDDYLKAEDWYLTEVIDKNISNIINKAQQYRPFVERLLFTDTKVKFQINREDIKLLSVNGIIKKDADGNVAFWVPLYKKSLHAAFFPYLNGEADRIRGSFILEDYFTEGGQFLIDKIIDSYKTYALRRRFRYFREKDKNGNYITLKEATLIYSLEAFMTAFLGMVAGKSYVEAHTGMGRTDLIVNVNNQEYVIEAKVYSDIVRFKDGKKQLATYAKSLSLTEAFYIVYVESEIKNPNVKEATEDFDGVTIKTHLVHYNLETDFSENDDRNT